MQIARTFTVDVYWLITAMFPVNFYKRHMIIMLPDGYRFPLSFCSLILLSYPTHPTSLTGGGIAVEMTNDICQTKYRPSSGKWVPVTTARRFLRLQVEERPPVRRVAANKLTKQSRTADKGWSSILGFGRGANNSSR